MDATQMMDWFPYVFPVFFVCMWLGVTKLLAWKSGWEELQDLYPDRDEPALLALHFQSGVLNAMLQMSGVLGLAATRTGLRLRILRLFGPFCRPFLVPWREIRVEPVTARFAFRRYVRLHFGTADRGTLEISERTWQRLARHAGPVGAAGQAVR